MIFDKDEDSEKILKKKNVFDLLKDNDKEINFEECGRHIKDLRIVTVDQNYTPVFNYKLVKKKEEISKDYFPTKANVNVEKMPLILLYKDLTSKKEAFEKYIFTKNYYIKQMNRNQYKDLYFLAEKLANSNKMMRVKALSESMEELNPKIKGNAIIIKGSGKPYPIAFIEGRIEGDKYALILHLAFRESKIPEKYIIL